VAAVFWGARCPRRRCPYPRCQVSVSAHGMNCRMQTNAHACLYLPQASAKSFVGDNMSCSCFGPHFAPRSERRNLRADKTSGCSQRGVLRNGSPVQRGASRQMEHDYACGGPRRGRRPCRRCGCSSSLLHGQRISARVALFRAKWQQALCRRHGEPCRAANNNLHRRYWDAREVL
jgi:phage terminase large subunit GpA-like protein